MEKEEDQEVRGKRVAQYLETHIKQSGLSQTEIASLLGYSKPNIITMFKQNRTPFPIAKVPLMAKILDVPAIELLRLVMSEYNPENWAVIERVAGESTLSANESAILSVIRKAAGSSDVRPVGEEETKELQALVNKWKIRAEASKNGA